MVMVLFEKDAETPAGNPLAPETPLLPMPVAPVVVWVIAVSGVLMHSVGVEEAALTVLVGFTVMVKLCGEPLQETLFGLFNGVTVIVALVDVVPEFLAVNAAMFPDPLAANPIPGLLLVQVNEVALVPVKLIAVVNDPLQTT